MQTLIDELENLINSAMRMPVGGKILVDEAASAASSRRCAPPCPTSCAWASASPASATASWPMRAPRRGASSRKPQAQLNAWLDEQGVVQAARQRAREIQTGGREDRS